MYVFLSLTLSLFFGLVTLISENVNCVLESRLPANVPGSARTSTAYFVLHDMLFPIIATLVVIAVRGGNFPPSAYVYRLYGFMLVRRLKDCKTAYAYGKSEIIRTESNAESKKKGQSESVWFA